MEKIFVVKRVAEKLWSSEAAIDEAVTSTSVLMADYMKAGRELQLSPVVTEAASAKIAEAAKALAEARAAIVAAHNELTEVKLRIGVRTKMDGFQKTIRPDEGEQAERRVG